jgi:addiction module RelE/StbE family toxin
MEVKFSKKFSKLYDKAPKKIQIAFDAKLELFLKNKFHPLLNNHTLTGKYRNCRSINITGNWRAIFREFDSGELIYFEVIGTHSQLYR